MDLSILEHLIPNVAGQLNVQPATLVFYVGLICAVANLVGRHIPDDKDGLMGILRDVCKIVGMYASNRVSSGVTTHDIVKSVAARAADAVVDEVIPEPIQDIVDEPVREVFTKYARSLELDPDETK